ncbi:hypothetical protein LguiA_036756 [Lonicera macranthoides]
MPKLQCYKQYASAHAKENNSEIAVIATTTIGLIPNRLQGQDCNCIDDVSLVTSIGSVSENGVAKRGRKVKEASDHIHHAIMTVIRRYDNLMNQVGVYMPMNASSNSRLMRYVYAEIQSHHIDSVSENGVANRRRKVKEAVTNHFLIAHDHKSSHILQATHQESSKGQWAYMPMNASLNNGLMRYVYAEIQVNWTKKQGRGSLRGTKILISFEFISHIAMLKGEMKETRDSSYVITSSTTAITASPAPRPPISFICVFEDTTINGNSPNLPDAAHIIQDLARWTWLD